MRILVTGGAGYIGSITVERLLDAGHEVTVLDTLVTGHREAVPEGAELVAGSVGDQQSVGRLLRERGIEAVLHCAARSLVGQSLSEPALYYQENVVGGVALLNAMREEQVHQLVFSSTAAVYGTPRSTPIDEDAPTRPINPYGATKLAFEEAMRWYGAACGIRSVSLRYFNAAGASVERGEQHEPETHLIPNLLKACLDGPPLTVFGNDYPTPDGTAIR
ncbi:MAG: UDP-glucose 4-epimerase, partial [Chloroflexi bacterium]|nr:UDP-glucose 4-epimerase [Chloroflexota bacterium]